MEHTIHRIWDGIKPFVRPEDSSLHEHVIDNRQQDDIDRISDVSEPEIHFFPAAGHGPHPAMLVAPGGGYCYLAWSHEGRDIASLLNLNGFSAFVLKYRCPDRRQAAHADAARAMRYIRFHADEFHIIPDKLGAMGFSAGGHLTATLAAPANPVPYPPVDAVDSFSCRPDFVILIYPAYLADENLVLAPEFRIDEHTPPFLLIQTENDSVGVECSLAWYLALKKAGVPAEMHLYAEGGHGYGLLRTGDPVSGWGTLAGEWLRRMAGIC